MGPKTALISSFVLLLLMSVSHATIPPEAMPFFTLLPIALMLVLLIIAIIYVLSKLLASPVLEAWTKTELQELFVSALIVFAVVAVVWGSNSAIKAFTGENDYITAATKSLTSQLGTMGLLFDELTKAAYRIGKVVGFSYSVSVGLSIVSGYGSFATRAGLSPLYAAVFGALDQLSQAILITSAEKLLLFFFAEIVPIYLLPIAIVMRTFPFTRRIGSALIAVSLGAYILFPFGIILAGEVFKSIAGSSDSPIYIDNIQKITKEGVGVPDIGMPPEHDIICSRPMAIFAAMGEWGWCLIICAVAVLLFGVGFAACCHVVHILYEYLWVPIFPIMWGPALTSYIYKYHPQDFYMPIYNYALPAVSLSLLLSIILFLLVVIFTIVGTRSISVALGGEAELYGISKLI